MPIPAPETIRARALKEGFAVCGFAEPHVPENRQERFHAFLSEGAQGTMTWMERRVEERADPRRLWPEVQGRVPVGLTRGRTRRR